MELRLLRSFATVAELHSFSRAAELLSVTQGAVSQQVAALEKELGVTLLERKGRTVKLSDKGRLFYDYARQILDLADAAQRELTGESLELQGTLRIATSTVPAEWLLPELLSEFCSLHEKVNEFVTVSDSAAAIRALESGAAEIGFVGDTPHSARLTAETIATDELVLVTSASHRFAKNKSATLKQLRDEAFIMREPGSGSRHCVEQALDAKGISTAELRIVMEVNSNDALRAAVRCGIGVAFLSKQTLCAEATRDPATIKIRGLRPRRDLYLVTHPARVVSTAARAFIEFVRERSSQVDPCS
jgi:DNA-binding transcriptional LysR family regulator